MHHITDYSSAFSEDEKEGNFLAFHVQYEPGATITAEVVGGTHGPVELDEDGIAIARITSTTDETIKIVLTEGGTTLEKVIALTGLTLETE